MIKESGYVPDLVIDPDMVVSRFLSEISFFCNVSPSGRFPIGSRDLILRLSEPVKVIRIGLFLFILCWLICWREGGVWSFVAAFYANGVAAAPE